MSSLTKMELVDRAFDKLRISGFTSLPKPGEAQKAILTLEAFCHELDGTGYQTGYNYESTPDPNSETGLDNSLHLAFPKVIALELVPEYGKGQNIDPMLLKQAFGAMSVIHRITKPSRKTMLPNTMPMGKAARSRYSQVSWKYHPDQPNAPYIPAPNRMYVDDVQFFQEDIGQWLQPGDTVASYTIEASTGLSILSSTLVGQVVKYTIKNTGESEGIENQDMQVKFVVTTTLGEVRTIKRYFQTKAE